MSHVGTHHEWSYCVRYRKNRKYIRKKTIKIEMINSASSIWKRRLLCQPTFFQIVQTVTGYNSSWEWPLREYLVTKF